MKKYKNYSRKFYLNAVAYFYATENLKKANEILVEMTPEQIEELDTLISEFNNDDFFRG